MTSNIFLSYENNIKQFVFSVVLNLEKFNIKCFVTPRNLLNRSNISLNIQEGINSSNCFVAFFSADYCADTGLMEQLKKAIELKKPVFIFRLDDSPIPFEIFNESNNVKIIDALEESRQEKGVKIVTSLLNEFKENNELKNIKISKEPPITIQEDKNKSNKKDRLFYLSIILGAIFFIVMISLNFEIFKNLIKSGNIDRYGEELICDGKIVNNEMDILYFCKEVTSELRESGYTSHCGQEYLNVIAKIRNNVEGSIIILQTEKFNPGKNSFEFYKMKSFEIEPGMNHFTFHNFIIDEVGLYRVFLLDKNNKTLTSGLLEIAKDNESKNSNGLLYISEDYTDKAINVSDAFTGGALTVLANLNDAINTEEIKLELTRIQDANEEPEKISTEVLKINPDFDFLYIKDVLFPKKGFYRVSISKNTGELIAENLVEITTSVN